MPYKIFFGQKYYNHTNSLSTIKKASLRQIKFTDEQVYDAINKNLPIIDKVVKKYLEYKAYKKDEGENREKDEEKNQEKYNKGDRERDRNENRKEVKKKR